MRGSPFGQFAGKNPALHGSKCHSGKHNRRLIKIDVFWKYFIIKNRLRVQYIYLGPIGPQLNIYILFLTAHSFYFWLTDISDGRRRP